MSGESASKHRLVVCPKCRRVLPESPDYDVYKCGGCGTILQAKKRRSGAVKSESSTHETDAAPRKALSLVSDDKQHGSGEKLIVPQQNGLGEKATSSSSGECSLNGNGGRGQIENGECIGEQQGTSNKSDEELENKMDNYEVSDIRRHRLSNDDCSNELTHREIEAPSELMAENSVENANDTNLQLEGEELSNGNMPSERAGEELICSSDKEDANNEKSALIGVNSGVDITRSNLEGAEELNNGKLLLGAEQELISGSDGEVNNDESALVVANPEVDITGTNKAEAEELNNENLLLEGEEEKLNICASDREHPKNDQSALVDTKSEVDIIGSASTAKRSSTEKFVSENRSISCVSPRKLGEGTSGNQVSSPNEKQKQVQKNSHHSFDCVRSVDIFDTTEVINPSLELSGTLGELSKSPATRSSHAYDGSISSNDGVDEQFPTQQLDSLENNYTVANGVSEGRSRKGKGLVNDMLYGDLETQHQAYLPSGKHHLLKDSRGSQNKVPETIIHGHPHWMRTKRDEFPSQMPFHRRSGSHSGYESGSPSNQTHDELYCSSSFLSTDSCEDPDQEKMKLLRMVYKLQDQLNRTSYINGETNGRMSTDIPCKGKHVSACHSHDLHEGRFYHGLDYPRCDGRCSHGINWHQRHNFSQPYLAEAVSSIYHVDHSCFHCCPQDWQCSAELPPHVLCQHEELCRSHLGHNCCSPHHSYPSSPQWFMTSKLPVPVYGRETKSGNERHRALELKKHFWEKQNLNKRHHRPVAGGAPFVTCHKCLKLLQLPGDFLLFKRVCHKLKCGACSEVLKFSLQNRSHIVSYAPNTVEPPSSDLDDQNEVINGSNLHSASHANYYHSSHADSVSYSDDYGHSVCKSCSSEGDPVALTPFHSLNDSEYDNLSVSPCTFGPITEKEKIASRGPSTSKAPVESDEIAVHSSIVSGSEKLSSEVEARSAPKSSPLHQLMGYASPSQMIKGIQSSIEGEEPTLNGENELCHNSRQN